MTSAPSSKVFPSRIGVTQYAVNLGQWFLQNSVVGMRVEASTAYLISSYQECNPYQGWLLVGGLYSIRLLRITPLLIFDEPDVVIRDYFIRLLMSRTFGFSSTGHIQPLASQL